MAVGDWVPMRRYGIQTGAVLDAALDTFSADVILVEGGESAGAVAGEVGSVEPESEVLTKRVVGRIIWRAAFVEPHTLLIHERIRVVLRDGDGTLFPFALNLNAADEANEPFLWERVSTIEVFGGLAETWPEADVGHPGWSEIDCRVARKLGRQDVLVYSVQVNAFEAALFDVTDIFTFTPFLRTWARSLG